MKHIQSVAISALIMTAFFSLPAQADPIKVPAYFQKMYVPGGYDSNDHVQIIGEGKFSNSCFRQAETTVRIDESQKNIYLGPVAYSYPGVCLMVIIPYQKTLDVGILKSGDWKIIQESNHITVGSLHIQSALKNSADDFLYAPISQGFFYQSAGLKNLVLTGEFTNSCMHLDQVKITVEPQVIAVQPIARLDTIGNCIEGHFPFSQTTLIDQAPAGRYLLHIRSLNGNAINSLIDIE